MKYYSVAVAGRGTEDPNGIDIVDYEGKGSDCPLEHCIYDNCDHHIVMWRGDEYSRRNTWIAADSDTTRSLEDAR